MRTSKLYPDGTIEYPDYWCFIGNSQMIIAESSTLPTFVTVKLTDVGAKGCISFSAATRNSHLELDVSQYLRALAGPTLPKRCVYAHIAIQNDGVSIFSFHVYAVCGSIQFWSSLPFYGEIDVKGEQTFFHRSLVWFRSYPFSVSLFRRHANESILYSLDGGPNAEYLSGDYNLIEIPVSELAHSNSRNIRITHNKDAYTLALFDNTFDDTFKLRFEGGLTEIIDITLRDETEGYYLRWLDGYGCLQYYLFAAEQSELRLNNTSFERDYGLNTRPVGQTVERSIKAAALGLSDANFDIVGSISNSPLIELYANGEWCPVTVIADTTMRTKNVLRDILITINVPIQTQVHI